MNRFAVIGLGQFGASVARTLADLGAEVLGLDADPQVVETYRDKLSQTIVVDATDEVAFRASGVDDADTVVVAIGADLEVSILVTAQLVHMAAPHIMARASSAMHEQILRLIGAHEVVNPEEALGRNIARKLVAPELRERHLLPTGHEFVEVAARKDFLGHTLGELDLHARFGVRVVALRKHQPTVTADGRNVYESQVVMDPTDEDRVEEGDLLAVIGTDPQIRALSRA
ncbi:MAG: potassium channel family protein [Myxococcota bacterium]